MKQSARPIAQQQSGARFVLVMQWKVPDECFSCDA